MLDTKENTSTLIDDERDACVKMNKWCNNKT